MTKVKFVDFWPTFDPLKDPIFSNLFNIFGCVIDEQPELIIFSVFGSEHEKYKCTKLFYAAENYKYNSYYINSKFNALNDNEIFKNYDFAITNYHIDSEKHIRIPAYLRKFGFQKVSQLNARQITRKHKFCLFVASNGSIGQVEVRNRFFDLLSSYKKVDSAGSFANNVGHYAPFDELAYRSYISDYKFMIAFENSYWPGYTSEKIIRCYQSNTVPIYWGNPVIEHDFNKKTYILVDEHKVSEAIQQIIELDNNEEKYSKMLLEPPVNLDRLAKSEQEVMLFFEKVLSDLK